MEININKKKEFVKIVHSKKARHLRISINSEKKVSLVIPRHASEEEGVRFLKSKIDWIEKSLQKMKPQKKQKWQYKFEDDSIIYFFGDLHRLRFDNKITYPRLQHHSERSEESSQKILQLPRSFRMTIETSPKKKIFENFLSNKLREHIYAFAYKFCKTNGFKFRDLKIKNMISRWGSCSRQGNLNFSIRLVHYPKEVINYVVIHELCHIREMNHSRKFWALVARFCPNYKFYIKQLK